MPEDRSLHWPSLAMRGDTIYVAANALPRAEGPIGSRLLVILRAPGSPMPGPPGDFFFKFPEVAFDSRGRLHLIWAEPADRHKAAQEWMGSVPTSLWHSSFDGASWSQPERLLEGMQVHWDEVPGGLAVDAANRLHVAVSAVLSNGHLAVVYLRRAGGTWSRRDFEGSSTYANLAVWARDSVAIAYVASQRSDSGRAQALFVTTSGDGGRSWKPASAVVRSAPNSIVDPVIQHAGGALHLVWSQGRPWSGSQVLRYLTSTDGGTGWAAGPDAPLGPEGPLLRFALAASSCGTVIALAEALGGRPESPRPLVDEIQWAGGQVTTRPLLPQAQAVASVGVVSHRGRFRAVLQAVTDTLPQVSLRTLTMSSPACAPATSWLRPPSQSGAARPRRARH